MIYIYVCVCVCVCRMLRRNKHVLTDRSLFPIAVGKIWRLTDTLTTVTDVVVSRLFNLRFLNPSFSGEIGLECQ